ncbi:haloacid dehalogenase superfamily, subfamily IA, variant 3 with third motif having DD or ED [Cognatiyoonia koreensis]|uniref:Haloacid dehalogenase superfamily, subfamily IA, variant 3 with third motif having DD or ED n=1 Tax=Cognatiyoonia koreensis TaxID=364200 RepID=A0A1I0RF00_9RHOB|nr:HAD family phosphatase [Cognatiyoonia koreensis]SEW39400.1 haloacid dehalogenase superfamily, subfamily IA, variant 3 with third motif having DD or ED [Cognatiyoonia koreensis]
MTLKLVIFDCDGVLVDSEPITSAVISQNLAKYGLPIPVDEVDRLFSGGTMQGVFETAKSEGAQLPDEWLDEIYALIFAELAKGVPVFPGLFDLLDELRAANVQCAVASNGPMQKMQITLTPSGLWDRLDGWIFSREHFRPKPAPDMIFHAMKVAGARDSETVFIDDTVSGCRAGIAAGVKTYGFTQGRSTKELSMIGAIPIHSMADIATQLLSAR